MPRFLLLVLLLSAFTATAPEATRHSIRPRMPKELLNSTVMAHWSELLSTSSQSIQNASAFRPFQSEKIYSQIKIQLLAGTIGTSGYGGDGVDSATSATLHTPKGCVTDKLGYAFLTEVHD